MPTNRIGQNITGIQIVTPGAGGDTGSQGINKIINSMDAIDAHKHTGNGDGLQLTLSSIDIDQDLAMGGNAVTDTRFVQYSPQSGTPTPFNIGYVKSDGELYYKDSLDNEVQITSGGSVVVAAGNLSGVTGQSKVGYTELATNLWYFTDSANNLADLQFKNALFTANGFYLSIKTPALASSYELTWPSTLPADTNQWALCATSVSGMSFQKMTVAPPTAGQYKFAYWNSTSGLAAIGPALDGQIMIGATSGAPALANITGTTNQVVVTNGTNSITISLPQNINSSASPTFGGMTLSGALNGSTGIFSGNISSPLATLTNATITSLSGTDSRVVLAGVLGALAAPYTLSTTATPLSLVQRNVSGNTVAVGSIASNGFSSDGVNFIKMKYFNEIIPAGSGTILVPHGISDGFNKIMSIVGHNTASSSTVTSSMYNTPWDATNIIFSQNPSYSLTVIFMVLYV